MATDSLTRSAPRASAPAPWPLYAIFFASGCAALVYQVMWTRSFGLVFGSTTRAAAVVLAAFFLGMAGGNWLGRAPGRRCARRGAASLRLGRAGDRRGRAAGAGLAPPLSRDLPGAVSRHAGRAGAAGGRPAPADGRSARPALPRDGGDAPVDGARGGDARRAPRAPARLRLCGEHRGWRGGSAALGLLAAGRGGRAGRELPGRGAQPGGGFGGAGGGARARRRPGAGGAGARGVVARADTPERRPGERLGGGRLRPGNPRARGALHAAAGHRDGFLGLQLRAGARHLPGLAGARLAAGFRDARPPALALVAGGGAARASARSPSCSRRGCWFGPGRERRRCPESAGRSAPRSCCCRSPCW